MEKSNAKYAIKFKPTKEDFVLLNREFLKMSLLKAPITYVLVLLICLSIYLLGLLAAVGLKEMVSITAILTGFIFGVCYSHAVMFLSVLRKNFIGQAKKKYGLYKDMGRIEIYLSDKYISITFQNGEGSKHKWNKIERLYETKSFYFLKFLTLPIITFIPKYAVKDQNVIKFIMFHVPQPKRRVRLTFAGKEIGS